VKILIVSAWHGDIYAQTFFNRFSLLGCDVYKFSWKEYFESKNRYIVPFLKFQNKYIIGPRVDKINTDLLDECKKGAYDYVFIYGCTHIYSKTLEKIKKNLGVKIFGYNNDDPFSEAYPKFFWRHFLNSINYYDHIFSYRYSNIKKYKSMSFEKVSLLRSYYRKDYNFPVQKNLCQDYIQDVVFIGHFEDDMRDEIFKFMIENGVNLKIYGPEWKKSKYYNFFVNYQKCDIVPLQYKDYNLAINGAKIALVFLSKLNNDTYTRRCFEIPATKTMMLSEFTNDLSSMFEEGVEAEYFRSKRELVDKINFYLKNDKERIKIGNNGNDRLLRSEHEAMDRCKQVLKYMKPQIF
jgi:spore maturation protein CgeB